MASEKKTAPAKSPSKNCYIFLGLELGKKQDAIAELKKNLSGSSPIEETVFYAGETPVGLMVDAIQNGSLFAESRLFLIKNAEALDPRKKKEIELLASCIAELESGTVLILISESNSIAKTLEEAIPKENRKIFYELFESEKNEWVRSFFRREGFSIDPEGIEAVLEMVENNTEALRRECSRLMFFLGKGKTIGSKDVEEWLSHSREESAFTLFSRIASGDFSKGIESLHTLLGAKESSQTILAGLAWCFRKLRDYLALAETGEMNNFELRKIGLASPKTRDDYAAASRRYNAGGADACLALTAEYDILLRTGGAALEGILMDLYLTKIFGAAGRT